MSEQRGQLPPAIRCTVCHEPIAMEGREWRHGHGDMYCGTGDGATAYPPAEHLTT